jgi:uncharacterized protein with ATP-grasp and redox domains
MKNSELKQLIREEIQKILKENDPYKGLKYRPDSKILKDKKEEIEDLIKQGKSNHQIMDKIFGGDFHYIRYVLLLRKKLNK